MVEGGDFESWFFLQVPIAAAGTGALTHLNSASADNLSTVPGVTATLAKKIVAEREANGPFKSLANLGERLKLSDKTIHALRGHVTLK
jgi:competence protein ComEA